MYPSRAFTRLAHAALAPLSVRQRRSLFHWLTHGRRPNLAEPRSFSEKVNWRVLHDRRSIIATCCDKLALRRYVADTCAGEVAMARVLWSGTDLAELAAQAFPARWVLKPNHGSGAAHLGAGQPTEHELRVITAGWLDASPSESLLGEWGYGTARRALILEERLGHGDVAPPDFKIFVFDGKPHLVQVDTDRFLEHKRRFYSCNWEPLGLRWGFPLAPAVPAPSTLVEMLRVATMLGAGLDFIRVDLYDVDGTVFLGEMSPYPESGLRRFHPPSVDRELGALWRLPE